MLASSKLEAAEAAERERQPNGISRRAKSGRPVLRLLKVFHLKAGPPKAEGALVANSRRETNCESLLAARVRDEEGEEFGEKRRKDGKKMEKKLWGPPVGQDSA